MTAGRRLEIYNGPDSVGRYHYAIFWLADYHPGHPDGENRTAWRGQHFFGPIPNEQFELETDKRFRKMTCLQIAEKNGE